MKEKILTFARAHPGALTGFTVGLIIAILLLTLGFWGTLLIGLLCGTGVWLGASRDKGSSVTETLYKLFRKVKLFFGALNNK